MILGFQASPMEFVSIQFRECIQFQESLETSDPKRRLVCKEGTTQHMTESKINSQASETLEKIPEEISVEMRKIAHDLSNALEIIVQTSYLLNTAQLKEPASDWLRMLDNGVEKAMSLNLALRTYIKEHTSH
jgi:predicted nuclease with TOPRIM domain